MAKALNAYDEPTIADDKGIKQDWASADDKIASLQSPTEAGR